MAGDLIDSACIYINIYTFPTALLWVLFYLIWLFISCETLYWIIWFQWEILFNYIIILNEKILLQCSWFLIHQSFTFSFDLYNFICIFFQEIWLTMFLVLDHFSLECQLLITLLSVFFRSTSWYVSWPPCSWVSTSGRTGRPRRSAWCIATPWRWPSASSWPFSALDSKLPAYVPSTIVD